MKTKYSSFSKVNVQLMSQVMKLQSQFLLNFMKKKQQKKEQSQSNIFHIVF